MVWQVLVVLSFAVASNRGQVRHVQHELKLSFIRARSALPSARYPYLVVQVMSAKKDPEKDVVFKRKSAVRPTGYSCFFLEGVQLRSPAIRGAGLDCHECEVS